MKGSFRVSSLQTGYAPAISHHRLPITQNFQAALVGHRLAQAGQTIFVVQSSGGISQASVRSTATSIMPDCATPWPHRKRVRVRAARICSSQDAAPSPNGALQRLQASWSHVGQPAPWAVEIATVRFGRPDRKTELVSATAGQRSAPATIGWRAPSAASEERTLHVIRIHSSIRANNRPTTPNRHPKQRRCPSHPPSSPA